MPAPSRPLPFWPLAAYNFIAMFVQGAFYSYISLAIFYDFSGTTLFTVSIIETIPFVANFIVIFWIGKTADKRRNHKTLFLVSLAALGIGNVAYLLIYVLLRNPFIFLGVLFPVSILFGIIFTSAPAYVSIIRPLHMGRFMGFVVLFQSIGSFLGGSIGGVLYAQFGIESIFWMGIIFPWIGVLIVARFLPQTPERIATIRQPSNTIQETAKSLVSSFHPFKNPILKYGLLFDFLLALGIGTFYKFFGIFYVQELHGPLEFVGISAGIASLLGALAGFWFGDLADRKSPLLVIIFGWAGYLVVFLGLFLQRDPVAAVIYWALPIYVEFIGMNKIIAELTPESARNRGIATSTISRNVGSAIGVITGGILSFWLTLPDILFITLLLFGPSLVLLLLTIKAYRANKAKHPHET